LSENDICPEIK